MELLVNRQKKNPLSTEGAMLVDGEPECVTLEPTDRNLDSAMSLDELKRIKVMGETAIPRGRYQVKKLYWPAPHSKYVPTLQNVPDYSGVGIHSVATHKDTAGCIGVGMQIGGPDLVLNGYGARDALYAKIFKAFDSGEEVWITVQNQPAAV